MVMIQFPEKFVIQAKSSDKILARIITQHGELYRLISEKGEAVAQVSGRLAYDAASVTDFPVVGDYVLADYMDEENAVIASILPRDALFVRRAAGTKGAEQAVAANIDYVFICMSLNKDFNLRRAERYLTIAWDSGAMPVMVLTKADLCTDIEAKRIELESSAPGVDIIVTSSEALTGIEALEKYLVEGKTVAFLGSSGVGKSTLINRLIGEAVIKTAEIRDDDDKGRHTTTIRQLIYLKNGGAVIDTPGMREIGVESGDTGQAFSEIEALAEQCRFSDCQHNTEPGCAVKAAVESGEISEERLESYKKLKLEMSYDGLTYRQLEKKKMDRMLAEIGGIKAFKNASKKDKWQED